MVPLAELVFKFGDLVYHRTDSDTPGILTAVIQRAKGAVSYEVVWQGGEPGIHQDLELTHEPPKFSSSEPIDAALR